MATTVAVLGTLDTKGDEVAFLAESLRKAGHTTVVMDLGLLGEPTTRPDVTRHDVANAADGLDLLNQAADNREAAMDVMGRGAGIILRRLDDSGDLAGAVAIGGSKGTWMATTALRELPWGMPKIMIASTVAGDVRRYTGHRDIVFMPTVVDLAGLNGMTKYVLSRGAAALGAMVDAGRLDGSMSQAVAMTMAGVVTPLGQRVQSGLNLRGVESVVFPANGSGGMALEEAFTDGQFVASIELALLEISNELIGGICSAGPARLEAAGRLGLPQVVVPGAIEFANFADLDSVPAALRGRPIVEHTPAITLVRLSADESRTLGSIVAQKLSVARGPVEVLVPLAGFSAYGGVGGPFADRHADDAFVRALHSEARADIAIHDLDLHVNDPRFAEAVLAAYDRVAPMSSRPPATINQGGQTS